MPPLPGYKHTFWKRVMSVLCFFPFSQKGIQLLALSNGFQCCFCTESGKVSVKINDLAFLWDLRPCLSSLLKGW